MKKAQADHLVETTAGTQMGNYLRDNWVPVMRSQRVVAGGAPERVRLFGDNFVVFRGSDGVVGIVDEACPHRGASLALARNVDCELHCLYHGWHIAPNGGVTAAPTEREREEFGDRIKTNHYPMREIRGIIWGYFGPQKQTPPNFPMFEWNTMPEENVHAQLAYVNANWLQVLEGVFDPMHVGILHSEWIGMGPSQILQIVCDIEVVERDYGFSGVVMREIPDAFGFLRVKEFAEPFFSFVPMPAAEIHTCIMAIPADDENTHMWYINYDTEGSLENYVVNNSHMIVGMENGMINPDNFREPMPTDRENLWGQRRDLMAQGHNTGLPGLVLEDVALLESQGAIQDRTKEHLGRSDLIVAKLRRRLLASAADYAENGRRDDSAVDYSKVRAIASIHLPGMNWEETPKFKEDFPEDYPSLPSMRATRPEVASDAKQGPGAASFTAQTTTTAAATAALV